MFGIFKKKKDKKEPYNLILEECARSFELISALPDDEFIIEESIGIINRLVDEIELIKDNKLYSQEILDDVTGLQRLVTMLKSSGVPQEIYVDVLDCLNYNTTFTGLTVKHAVKKSFQTFMKYEKTLQEEYNI